MSSVLRHLSVAALMLAAPALAAGSDDQQEGLQWLKKMASASRQLNYTGTFVYRYGNRAETSRIVHYVNSAGGEFERMETLDGPAREVIRTNDQVVYYLPDSKTVVMEKRTQRRFPAMVPEQLGNVTENYVIRTPGMDRVAGLDCRVIVLEPKDKLRYGRSYCADAASGLPLRARTFNEKKEPLESFLFTELKIGGSFNRDKVRSRYAAKSKDWRVDHTGVPTTEIASDTGWVLNRQPAGFRKLTELKRLIAGRSAMVSHIVFSDGLAAVSVFIEPLPSSKVGIAHSLSHQGAVNIYMRPVADHLVTVLGEAPAATVMQIANSLEFRGAAHR